MARAKCDNCNQPQVRCFCPFITPLKHQTKLIIMQHPSELKAAKGTVKLLQMMSQNIEVWVGESQADFSELQQQLQGIQVGLLYPDEQAVSLDGADKPQLDALILLDGTWKKTYKILQLNPWLQALPKVSFNAPKGRYHIRKAPRADSLSTLEAACFALEAIESFDARPWLSGFEAFMQQQIQLMAR
ncbi:tRNA-uridine aminocarboxypropyltransferase [Paraferrimonas sp. SM1919]|uniref:tRNA-uridine aminocarboxypropyltransferase n=1 Tax=Paraferrimonas sp. SM1919 TaxID=2662263 RepID=UPI0013D125F3|nr:tRNA-uridine aminocarboxypropyltransferase [Paraferrimonas sp. SM1919]